MSSTALTKLTIAHLRGAVEPFELPFEKGRKLTIIYGENGTGKSTICDALEFLSKGKIGSLDNRGLGTNITRYWSAVNKTSADVSVVLDAAGATCRATMNKANVIADPPEARPQVEVLRRSQILALLETTPGKRYEAISRFIDVSGIETSEQALRGLIKDLNSSRDIAAARISENQDSIEQFWAAAGRPGTSALAWAEAETQRDPDAPDPELAALASLERAYLRLADHPARLVTATELLYHAQADNALAEAEAESQLQVVAQNAGDTIDLLQAAQQYLQQHPDLEHCPLCESTDAAQGLARRVDQRLSAFANLQQALARKTEAQAQFVQAHQHRNALAAAAATDVEAFEQVRASFAWSPDVQLPADPAPRSVEALEAWLAATTTLPDQWRNTAATRQGQDRFLATLKSALYTYTENRESQRTLDILLPNLQRTLEIVEEERKAFTDSVLSKIAGEVGRLYEVVHPGEGLNKIRLELDTAKRASLEIATSFAGHPGPPQAYFSQSHLDTLGLCVFLALANLDTPDNTILVLDDVLASVDEPHVERLISMLYNESLKFRHCIITTHYGPWRHKLRWGWLKNNQCQFVELSRWSNTQGISVIRSVPEVERLQALLDDPAPDLQSICAKAGVILEAALDFLTQLYECSVPRKSDQRYTLGDLLPAIRRDKGKLSKALRVEVLSGKDATGLPCYTNVDLGPIIDELHRISQARNVFGAHFNAISFDLLDSDAMDFGRYVLALIEALVDPDAGWPRSAKSGSYWANAGETRRLHPLKQPS